jgi:replication factor C subunit 3/5
MGRKKLIQIVSDDETGNSDDNSSDQSGSESDIIHIKSKKNKNVDMMKMYEDVMDCMNEFREDVIVIKEKVENATLPWIEKFRPKSLDDVISHENIIFTLNKFIEKQQLPHLIFRGPPGTGKTSTIMACARKLYGNNYSTMVLDINASEERGVDAIRGKVGDFVSTKGIFLKEDSVAFKLVILDEADAMTLDAQSALVSVMEKHTLNVRFCLICNYVKKINPAIQSRCVIFKFSPLSKENIKTKLNQTCTEMNLNLTSDGANEILKIAKGDMRKVLNILQATSMSYDIINSNNVSCCIGYPLTTHTTQIYNSVFNDDFSNAYTKIADLIHKNGYSLMDVITELTSMLLTNFIKGKIEQKKLLSILINLREIEMNLNVCPNEYNQIAGLVGVFKL